VDVSQRVSLNFRFTPSLGGSMRAVSYFAPFLVALSLTPAIGAETAVDRAKEDEIVSVPKGDPDMEEAFRQARETPKGFLDLARAPRSTITSMAVKVAVHDGASCRCRSDRAGRYSRRARQSLTTPAPGFDCAARRWRT
jgi:hypothetical protein